MTCSGCTQVSCMEGCSCVCHENEERRKELEVNTTPTTETKEEDVKEAHPLTSRALRFRQHAATQAAGEQISFKLSSTLAEIERDFILAVLKVHKGNRTAAATALGVSRRTLINKLHEYTTAGYKACGC